MEKCLEDVTRKEEGTLNLPAHILMRWLRLQHTGSETVQSESVESLLAQVQQLLKKVVIGLAAQQAEIERSHGGNYSFWVEKPSWILIAHLRCKPGNV